ncbi:MAG: YbaB/EbfC family nucleoid-associated protein [Candidatus Berkelbacteria bacterium]|nr:YbaB/EbfC family nucleoid-associated protein [Candidatus Berkelbacteria bacterium]
MDKFKQAYDLQKKAKEIQKNLKNTEIEAKSTDLKVAIVLTADQKIRSIEIDESLMKPEMKKELEEKLVRVMSEGLSRVQAVAASKTKELMGDLGINLPGM